jgi:N-hydroxyarylamine O-acetyltransferase
MASQDLPDLDDYFKRIGIARPAPIDCDSLARIALAHVLSIPFESLDPFLGRRVSLSLKDVERKLVHEGRGGYCFEHNLLLRWVLISLGYEVESLAATVLWRRSGVVDVKPTHHFLRVYCGRPYLVDVGFAGVVLTGLLDMTSAAPQTTSHGVFNLRESEGTWTLAFQTTEGWEDMYKFDGVARQLTDFHIVNEWISTNAESRFVRNLIAARATTKGLATLLNREFTTRLIDGTTTRRELSTTEELLNVLSCEFGIATATLPTLAARLEKL